MYYLAIYLTGSAITYGATFAKLRLGIPLSCRSPMELRELCLSTDRYVALFCAVLWPYFFFYIWFIKEPRLCLRRGLEHGILFRSNQADCELAVATIRCLLDEQKQQKHKSE